jgi:hypothetical protein
MVGKTLSQKTHHKKGLGGVAQGIYSELKHQYHTQKRVVEWVEGK